MFDIVYLSFNELICVEKLKFDVFYNKLSFNFDIKCIQGCINIEKKVFKKLTNSCVCSKIF